jgi:hypothetical protein
LFTLDNKIEALVENYGIVLLLEQNEIAEGTVVRFLVDEGLIDLNDYFNLDAEYDWWEEQTE